MSAKRKREHQVAAESSSTAEQWVIQAHEASLIYGHEDVAERMNRPSEEGGRLQLWPGVRGNQDVCNTWDVDEGENAQQGQKQVWVDRYDALNLLDSYPVRKSRSPSPSISVGFSDLPSDSEEMFYFSIEEREDIGRRKKRAKMEEARAERIKAREVEEDVEKSLKHGRNDDEMEKEQLSLMQALHSTLTKSSNSSLLEIRVLANHGADPRFQFLRKDGRWRSLWQAIRNGELVEWNEALQEVVVSKKNEVLTTGEGVNTLGLVAYGTDSEDEVEAEQCVIPTTAENGSAEAAKDPPNTTATVQSPKEDASLPLDGEQTAAIVDEERERKETKARKAKEWARKRQEARKQDVALAS